MTTTDKLIDLGKGITVVVIIGLLYLVCVAA